MRGCAEVREPIELSFDVVSGVGPGIDLLNGGSIIKRTMWYRGMDVAYTRG